MAVAVNDIDEMLAQYKAGTLSDSAFKSQIRTTGPAVERTCETVDYKNAKMAKAQKVMRFAGPHKPYSLGLSKLITILECVDEIRAFCKK